jgi:hypothetical protein
MSWATRYIKQLQGGDVVVFRPRGHSMTGRISSGQQVTVEPIVPNSLLKKKDVVLCKVNSSQYLHLITAIKGEQVQISNNHGKINGWIHRRHVFGKCIKVED